MKILVNRPVSAAVSKTSHDDVIFVYPNCLSSRPKQPIAIRATTKDREQEEPRRMGLNCVTDGDGFVT